MSSRPHLAAGVTLVELVLSLSVMSLMLGAMVSAVLLASHALPDDQDPTDRAIAVVAAVEEFTRDLALAKTMGVAQQNTIEFTVDDRGHDDADPETIRYEWSGTAGDPLIREYNGTPITVFQEVEEFSLSYSLRARPLQRSPRVLLVVHDKNDAADLAKLDTFQSWGFLVEMIESWQATTDFDAAVRTTDVIFFSETINAADLADKSLNFPVGAVTEQSGTYPALGIWEGASAGANTSFTNIVDVYHAITFPFETGPLLILSQNELLIYTSGSPAPGARVLAGNGSSWDLVVLEVGARMYGGGTTQGRRVKLPWGANDFVFGQLNEAGLTLTRRALAWAAAPVGYSGVQITLQVWADAAGRAEAQVDLLNVPRVIEP